MTPNFSDPRVIKRTCKVIGWAKSWLSQTHAREWHSSILTEIFGNSTKPLSAYLRSKLLVENKVGPSYVVGSCSKTYFLNGPGLADLLDEVKHARIEPFVCHESLTEVVQEQLEAKRFVYKDSSDRLFHPLQNMSKSAKSAFWEHWGLPYNYDIVACAPTLLYQFGLTLGVPVQALTGIEHYLQNKTDFRKHVQTLTGLSEKNAKALITSLFNGARLAANTKTSAYRLLGYDGDALARLKNDDRVKSLRMAIALIWRRVKSGTCDVAGVPVRTSKEKWAIYFKLERKVMDVVRDCLDEQQVLHFDEHDGFRANKKVCVSCLEECVKKKLGLVIHFEEEERDGMECGA